MNASGAIGIDLGAALLGLVIAFVFKIAVMFAGARLLLRLYRTSAPARRPWLLVPAENRLEFRLLYWSLVLFAASELACGVEIYILLHSSPILGAAHAVLSGSGTGLFALGLYLYVDRAVIRFGSPSCVLARSCRVCTVTRGGRCRYDSLVLVLVTFVVLAALVPLFAPTTRLVADARRYALPFPALNLWFEARVVPWIVHNFGPYDPSGAAFYIPRSQMIVELRILPLIALCLGVASLILVRRHPSGRGLHLAVLASGILAYVLLQVVLYFGTGDALSASLGHEVAELWFLVATQEFLRRTFGARETEALRPAPVSARRPGSERGEDAQARCDG